MLATLLEKLKTILQNLTDGGLEKIKGILLSIVTKVLEWGMAWIEMMRTLGNEVIGTTLAAVQTFIPSISLSSWTSTVSSINYFFPLSEILGLLSLYWSLWATVKAYKMVKKWIPFLPG